MRIARYTYKGAILPLSGWAKRLGADLKALEARLACGWSVQKSFETPFAPDERPTKPPVPYRPPRTSYILEADGRFMTVKEWAKELNCKKDAIYYCLRFNRPLRCAGGETVRFTPHRAYEHDGTALRACDWAKRLNITCGQFLRRIEEGLGEADVFRDGS